MTYKGIHKETLLTNTEKDVIMGKLGNYAKNRKKCLIVQPWKPRIIIKWKIYTELAKGCLKKVIEECANTPVPDK